MNFHHQDIFVHALLSLHNYVPNLITFLQYDSGVNFNSEISINCKLCATYSLLSMLVEGYFWVIDVKWFWARFFFVSYGFGKEDVICSKIP